MPETAQQFKQTESQNFSTVGSSITASQLLPLVEDWLADCQIRQHSNRTIELRRMFFGRLDWFLKSRQATQCSRAEMRQFFAYLTNGHQGTEGRWDKGKQQQWTKPLRPCTIGSYYHHMRAFFNWLVAEEYITTSPMDKIARPVDRPDQVQPFTKQQIEDLLNAAQHSKYPRRDTAIIRFLLDTGIRVSELCELRMEKINIIEGQAYILGKGNKFRTVCFGRRTARALRAYLRNEQRSPEDPVFLSERGEDAGSKFTRWGVRQIIERLGLKAGIQATRCSPHTFRHTFAIEFLRNGGNVFTLKQLLGHTGLQVTNRYVALAQADIQTQHRQFSPGDRIG